VGRLAEAATEPGGMLAWVSGAPPDPIPLRLAGSGSVGQAHTTATARHSERSEESQRPRPFTTLRVTPGAAGRMGSIHQPAGWWVPLALHPPYQAEAEVSPGNQPEWSRGGEGALLPAGLRDWAHHIPLCGPIDCSHCGVHLQAFGIQTTAPECRHLPPMIRQPNLKPCSKIPGRGMSGLACHHSR
jgi:hypothetical protein